MKTRTLLALVCAAALVLPGGKEWVLRGECPGVIVEDARGTGGFGYDPHFLYEEKGLTFAQMAQEDKNVVSHRARAMAKMLPVIRNVPLLILMLALTIPAAILGMRLAEGVMKKQAAKLH